MKPTNPQPSVAERIAAGTFGERHRPFGARGGKDPLPPSQGIPLSERGRWARDQRDERRLADAERIAAGQNDFVDTPRDFDVRAEDWGAFVTRQAAETTNTPLDKLIVR